MSFEFRLLTEKAKKVAAPPMRPRTKVFKRDPTSKKLRLLCNAVLRFCFKNPGFSVMFGGPGERTVRTDAPKHFDEIGGPVFMRSLDGKCMTAALTNAVDVVKGRQAAEKAKEYLTASNTHYLILASRRDEFHKAFASLDLRKISKSDLVTFLADKFAWLANLDRGVWLVRLVLPGCVGHCVVIDVERKIIIDSEEPFPMRLIVEGLKISGEDEVDKVYVAEVRSILPAVRINKKIFLHE